MPCRPGGDSPTLLFQSTLQHRVLAVPAARRLSANLGRRNLKQPGRVHPSILTWVGARVENRDIFGCSYAKSRSDTFRCLAVSVILLPRLGVWQAPTRRGAVAWLAYKARLQVVKHVQSLGAGWRARRIRLEQLSP
jgi:hypothetical protein